MEILLFDEIDSTQNFLTKAIREGKIKKEIAILANFQTNGVGSRGDKWISIKGNFFASIAIKEERLPKDLPLYSASIYFAFLIKEILKRENRDLRLKWPNDLYIKDKKCGGVITSKIRDFFIIGVGVNFIAPNSAFGSLKWENGSLNLLSEYIEAIKKSISWKEIFSKYKLEFNSKDLAQSAAFRGTVPNKWDILQEDGSLQINGERIYSKR